MPTERIALQLVDLIYAAAERPERWREFLEQFAAAVGGSVTTFILQDIRTQRGLLAESVNADPDWVRRYDDYFCHQNLYMIHGAYLMKPGRVLTSQMLCPDEIVLASEFYADYLRPLDVFEQIGAVLVSDRDKVCAITTMRSRSHGPFEEEKVRLLELLMPHLERGIRLHDILQQSLLSQRSVETALERSSIGTIIMNDEREVVVTNAAARAILERGDGIRMERSGLSAVKPSESTRLNALIATAIDPLSPLGPRGGTMMVSRSSGRRQFQILVAPLAEISSRFSLRTATVAIFIIDPDSDVVVDLDLLRQIHGFTPAEAHLAAELMRGYTVNEAATLLRISPSTARTRLKQMFAKTDTRRQTDLVLLLTKGLAAMSAPRS